MQTEIRSNGKLQIRLEPATTLELMVVEIMRDGLTKNNPPVLKAVTEGENKYLVIELERQG